MSNKRKSTKRRTKGEGSSWFDKKTGRYFWRFTHEGKRHTIADSDQERAKARFIELQRPRRVPRPNQGHTPPPVSLLHLRNRDSFLYSRIRQKCVQGRNDALKLIQCECFVDNHRFRRALVMRRKVQFYRIATAAFCLKLNSDLFAECLWVKAVGAQYLRCGNLGGLQGAHRSASLRCLVECCNCHFGSAFLLCAVN